MEEEGRPIDRTAAPLVAVEALSKPMLPLQVTPDGRQVAEPLPDQRLWPSSLLGVARASWQTLHHLTTTRCGQQLARRRAWP